MDTSAVFNRDVNHDSIRVSRAPSISGIGMKGAGKHTLGLLLLLCVVFLWTLGNFLGSSIFANDSYAKPFFMTYLNTSIFVLMMGPRLANTVGGGYRAGTLRSTMRSFFSRQTLSSFVKGVPNPQLQASLQNDGERESLLKPRKIDITVDALPTASSSTVGSLVPGEATVHFAKAPEYSDDEYLDIISTARLAFMFCILWFGANYFTMACLQYTTVASTTILTSTSSVWTLLIGTLTRTERFTWKKLCGVLASLFGIILISHLDLTSGAGEEKDEDINPTKVLVARFVDFVSPSTTASGPSDKFTSHAINVFPDKSPGELILGDSLALLSAIIYGFYTITLKRATLSAYPRSIHMPTFFGLVGIFNIVLLFPLFPLLHYTGAETFELPPDRQIWTILIVNSISSLLSDVLWAYAMVLTSPLVVTVGLSLTIPLSLVGEMFIQERYEGWAYWLGAMVVVGSFVFVEREEVKEEEEVEREFIERSLESSMILSRSGLLDVEIAAAGAGAGTASRFRDLGGCEEVKSSKRAETTYGSS